MLINRVTDYDLCLIGLDYDGNVLENDWCGNWYYQDDERLISFGLSRNSRWIAWPVRIDSNGYVRPDRSKNVRLLLNG